MGADSSIERHLRAGQDRRARIAAAVEAFRRLDPADYGQFLATIEDDLRTSVPELDHSAAPPLFLAGPPEPVTSDGALREAVMAILADGQEHLTQHIRLELEKTQTVKREHLKAEIALLRKTGIVRSTGTGRGQRHMLVARAETSRTSSAASKRAPTASRPPKRKRDDDEDHAVPTKEATKVRSLDAEQLYAAAIGDHQLLKPAEELELAKRLEEVEITFWKRVLDGPLATEVRQLFFALDPPVDPADAQAARGADLDRLVTARLLAEHPDSEHALAAEAGRIREHFATCNLRLVLSTIHRHGYHLTTTLSMSDLVQEGNLGLLRAIPRFDYRRGLRFSTFATWWIRHFLVRARQNFGSEVRVPVHLQDLAAKVGHTKKRLRRELGREPTRTEIATTIKVSKASLAALDADWPKYREAIPMFDSVGEEGELPSFLTSDTPIADEILARVQEDTQLNAAVDRLPAQLAEIVRRRFGLDGIEPEMLTEIATTMNLSRERIRQLEKKGLGMLRQVLGQVLGAAETKDVAA